MYWLIGIGLYIVLMGFALWAICRIVSLHNDWEDQ